MHARYCSNEEKNTLELMVHLCTNLGRVLILRVKYIKEDIKIYI